MPAKSPKPAAFFFHGNHGKLIKLSEDKQTAEKRGDDDKGGIVMSRDPMEVGKLYEVKLYKDGEGFGWSFATGVVTSSPGQRPLAEWAGGLKNAVVVYWNAVTDHGVKTSSERGEALKTLGPGDRVGVSVDSDRALHLHVNGKDQGVVSLRPLPHHSHAFFQLWGPFTKATVTVPLADRHEDSTCPKPKASAFRFHDNHGKNVVLSNKKRTAERLGDWLDRDGIVMSRDPIDVNKLYEVQLTTIGEGSAWSPTVGVVTSSPEELEVPQVADRWRRVVAVDVASVTDRGHRAQTLYDMRQSLCNLPVGSRVGLCVDVRRHLHLFVNGQHEGKVTSRSLPEPCYVMFDLSCPCEVTSLAVTDLKSTKPKGTP